MVDADLGASAGHERRKITQVQDAAAALARAVREQQRARKARDQAVRAAVKTGIPPSHVAKAASLSLGRVAHLTIAPRP